MDGLPVDAERGGVPRDLETTTELSNGMADLGRLEGEEKKLAAVLLLK